MDTSYFNPFCINIGDSRFVTCDNFMGKILKISMTKEEARRHNRRLAKKRVQCLNKTLCFVSSLVLADSLVLRNPLLRQAAKRYVTPLKNVNPSIFVLNHTKPILKICIIKNDNLHLTNVVK